MIGCITALSALPAYGQDVTISPSSGQLIAGLTYTGEVGFEQGWSSLWRHNQLPLTLHVSDKKDLTSSGVLKDPAGNISLDKSQNLYIVDGGESVSTLMCLSLPKGFRFTRYRIVLLNNINGKTINSAKHTSMSKQLYETGSTFDYENPLAATASMGSTNETKDYVIERTSKTASDMTNNLYFYFWHEKNGFYGATIKSIELYFTAESEFQAEGVPGAPDEIISDGVNMVGSEFTTGKLDLGLIQPNTKSGVTYYSYDYKNVIDLTAQNWLYQENAVTAGKLPATAGSGNIQVLRNDGQLYYALGNGTYYIETPTETKNQNGKTIPLGYRITGAEIKAHYGTQANASPITYDGKTGTISYTTGYLLLQTTYYLQTNGYWKTSPETEWTLTKTGKLQSGNYYLSVQTSGSGNKVQYIINGTRDINQASTFTVNDGRVMWGDNYLSMYDKNSRARFYSDDDKAATWTAHQASVTNPAFTPSDFKLDLYGTNKDNVEAMANVSSSNKDANLSVQKSGTEYIANGTTDINEANGFTLSDDGHVMYGELTLSITSNDSARFMKDDGSYNNFASWNVINSYTTNPAFTPSDFKLELYGTKKDNVEERANVSSSNTNATLSVSGLNNDAVKFTISGLADGTKALITYNLTMEQLNPFINTLDIVCHSKKMAGQTITQQFTSNDFQVAGGAFHFYVPAAFADANNNCTFTFENLTSKYMDSTYGHGTNGNSRNYFVKSAYYNKYGDGMQYTATGDENASTKVSTAWCANQPFKYNNAHELANDNVSATATTLEEYPYSEARYTASDGSGTITGEKGTFTDNIELQVNSGSKDCYLTTGDETRYNIAPTTAMEHRYYAFYLMKIDLDVQEYDAYCRMTKLYDATCYEGDLEKPMYGGTFEAYEKGHAGDKQYQISSDLAFLSVSMMVDALKAAETQYGFTADQVLYLDYTNLYSVLVESKENMADMKGKLNPNCLIFFPQRTVYNEDNYVSKTQSGDYRACKNIIITDKQPFYSPYKITVPAENYAAYTRKIELANYNKTALATLVLPFSIEVSEGVHVNNNSRISLYQMQTNEGLTVEKEEGNTGKDFWAKATFSPIAVSRTVPNMPYMVQVEKFSDAEDVNFEILQYGSDVEATVSGEETEAGCFMNKDYTFQGPKSTGTIDNATHAFTLYGSYSGKKLIKDGGWFYFANSKFYNSKNLKGQYLYSYPFRAYFGHETSNGNGAKVMRGFSLSFGDDATTDIADLTTAADDTGLTLSTRHGQLTVTASSETTLTVVSAAGVTMCRTTLGAGETKTVSLATGLYIVNGKKVVVP